MFIYSLRASTVKLVGVVCVALTVLITLIAFVPTYSIPSQSVANTDAQSVSYSYDKVKNAQDVISFLSQFGWEVGSEPVEVKTVTIPAEFDKVFAAYNELQRAQGLDLSGFGGRVVERYTYTVRNYEGFDGPVQANLLIHRGRVIGGDICAAQSDGFLHGFARPA